MAAPHRAAAYLPKGIANAADLGMRSVIGEARSQIALTDLLRGVGRARPLRRCDTKDVYGTR